MTSKYFKPGIALLCGIVAISAFNALGSDKNSLISGIYVTAGYGKSFPNSKVKSFTLGAVTDFYETKKLKDSNVFKFAVGKDFGHFRSEFEFLYSDKHKFNTSYPYPIETKPTQYSFHTSHKTYFINAFYDFKNFHKQVKPYIGFGIGWSQNTLSKKTAISSSGFSGYWDKKKNNSFAYNLALGTIFNVNEKFYVDLAYKYIDLGKLKSNTKLNLITNVIEDTQEAVKGKTKSHVVLLGIGFKF